MKFTRHSNSRRSGFTLVEMLIVLGILVALFALVLPRFLGSQKRAKIDIAKTQIGSFRAALERYHLDCDRFPSTEQGLSALVSKPSDLAENVSWYGPYVSGDIAADPWGNSYQYEFPPSHGNGDMPDIWSYGPDGEEGTDDDVCSWTGGSSAGGGETAGEEPAEGPRPSANSGPKASTPKASTPTASRTAAPKAVRSEPMEK